MKVVYPGRTATSAGEMLVLAAAGMDAAVVVDVAAAAAAAAAADPVAADAFRTHRCLTNGNSTPTVCLLQNPLDSQVRLSGKSTFMHYLRCRPQPTSSVYYPNIKSIHSLVQEVINLGF